MARKAFGVKLIVSTNGSSSWSAVGKVKDVSGPDISRESIDVTSHDSLEEWTEKLPGLKDGGTVSFEVEYEASASQVALLTSLSDDNIRYFGLIEPEGTVNGYATETTNALCWRFTGFISKLGNALPVNGSIRQTVEITVTGKPVYYPAS